MKARFPDTTDESLGMVFVACEVAPDSVPEAQRPLALLVGMRYDPVADRAAIVDYGVGRHDDGSGLMAYDEGLAERIRGLLDGHGRVSERRMFGGLAFLVGGHMTVGIVKDDLMVRVGPDTYSQVVRETGARPMDFTGRPMKGFVFVSSDALESDADLKRWVDRGVAFAASLPPKESGSKAMPTARRRGARI